MKKIYVVTSGCYSDYRIERVFSTRELAEEFIDHDAYCDIEEYVLDGEMPPRKEIVFSIMLDLNTKEVISLGTGNEKEKDYVHVDVDSGQKQRKYIMFYIKSDSRERAIKVASERFGEVIAQEQFKFPYLRVGVIRGCYNNLVTPYYDFKTGEIVLRGSEEFGFEVPDFVKVRKEE